MKPLNLSLNQALETYSTWELSTILNVSETSVRRYKLGEKNLGLPTKSILNQTINSLNRNMDFREIYFNSWIKRILSNLEWVKLRLLRDILGITSEQIAAKMNCSRKYINRIEMLETKSSEIMFDKYKNTLFSIKKPSKEDLKMRDKYLDIFISQLKELKKYSIKEVVKIVPTFNKDKYYGGDKLYDFLKNNFTKFYFGPILSDSNGKKYMFDILCINDNKKYLFELKSMRYSNRTNLKNLISYVYPSLKGVNEIFPDYKLGLILSKENVGIENRSKFLKNNFLIIDKEDIQSGKYINNFLKKDVLSGFSYQQLVFILESSGGKIKGSHLSNKVKELKSKLKDPCFREKIYEIISNEDIRQKLFKINRELSLSNPDLVFVRNARKLLKLSSKEIANLFFNGHEGHMISFERGVEFSQKKLNLYKKFIETKLTSSLIKKLSLYIERENERWDIAENYFPFVIHLRGMQNDFESFVFEIFKKNGFVVLKNVEVSDKDLKLKCGGRFPEIDILAMKNSENYMIMCNTMNNTHINKFLKNAVLNLKELKKIGKINFLILVTNKTPSKEIISYGEGNGVRILSINELKKFLGEDALSN